MQTSEKIGNIAAALCQFQGTVSNPKKDSVNPHFRSKYADLDAIITAIRPALLETGLSFIQNQVRDEQGNIGVYTMILHKSGEFFQLDPVYVTLDKKTAQGIGSALTYAKRYSLSMAFGIAADEDDDANSITPPPNQPQRMQNKPQPQTKQKPAQQPKQEAQPTGSKPQGMANETQRKKIFALGNNLKLNNDEIKEIVLARTKKQSTKELTTKEASDLIEYLEKEKLVKAFKGGVA
ncbi:ERF family protein [Risungbinella massiliensis]|uniref:ERF family protein n=1 Tax=Risungbinella massiliensis TaxID=1329796 RepID=UPI0005CC5EC2|nr:ERF family protein [Risungbinella massiliensis]